MERTFFVFFFLCACISITSALQVTNTHSRVTIDGGLQVIADEFNGSTTNFLPLTNAELESINNMTLEYNKFGKIIFLETINLTVVQSSNQVDLDSYIEIANNSIYVNTTYFTNLNRSAQIFLYNLYFSDTPTIFFNNASCPSYLCTFVNYTNNTFIFNVSFFSEGTYSANGTRSSSNSDSGNSGGSGSGGAGGGGGASGAAPSTNSFNLSLGSVSVKMQQDKVLEIELIVENYLDEDQVISITRIGNAPLTLGIPSQIAIKAHSSIAVTLTIAVPASTLPNVYIQQLIFESSKGERLRLPVTVAVSTPDTLFDVEVAIPPQYRTVHPGNEINAIVSLSNFGRNGKVDVIIEYGIKDEEGRLIVQHETTAAMETQYSFVAVAEIPHSTPQGQYTFYVIARYENKVATGAASFNVDKYSSLSRRIFFVLGIVPFLLIAWAVWLILQKSSHRRKK